MPMPTTRHLVHTLSLSQNGIATHGAVGTVDHVIIQILTDSSEGTDAGGVIVSISPCSISPAAAVAGRLY
jgi:hypothetical protein